MLYSRWLALQPYWRLMRFDKPIGIYLLMWPMLCALWLAARGLPPLSILIVFVLGVVCMRAAGCVINDLADRNFDGHVARTQHRPLVSGAATVRNSWLIFFSLLVCAFLLVLTQNRLTICLSFVAVFLASLYPFTKRFVPWPQIFLGAAFAWAVPMACAAVLGVVPRWAILIFAIAWLWPVMYDTEYAMVDRADDLKIGIHSTAILFGRFDRLAIGMMQIILCVGMLSLGLVMSLHWFYYLACIGVGCCFVRQQWLIRKREPAQCFKAFLENNLAGALWFVGIVLGVL